MKKPKLGEVIIKMPLAQDDAETSAEIRERLGLSAYATRKLLRRLNAEGRLRTKRALRFSMAGYFHGEVVYWIVES